MSLSSRPTSTRMLASDTVGAGEWVGSGVGGACTGAGVGGVCAGVDRAGATTNPVGGVRLACGGGARVGVGAGLGFASVGAVAGAVGGTGAGVGVRACDGIPVALSLSRASIIAEKSPSPSVSF